MKKLIPILIVLLLIAAFYVWADKALGAEYLPECDAGLPSPPLVLVLPDGTEVPISELHYDLASRRITAIGNPRLFCDGFDKTDA